MKGSLPLIAAAVASLIQGCANPPTTQSKVASPLETHEVLGSQTEPSATQRQSTPIAGLIAIADKSPTPVASPSEGSAAKRTEVPAEKGAPQMEGHPLTSVVVTQCNLLVAVYVTMPDGKLLRFDKTAGVPPEQLLTMAYAATRSERVEVSCENPGIVGYETHMPL
jgi:hypothetical protein